jgi:hypothetical protein
MSQLSTEELQKALKRAIEQVCWSRQRSGAAAGARRARILTGSSPDAGGARKAARGIPGARAEARQGAERASSERGRGRGAPARHIAEGALQAAAGPPAALSCQSGGIRWLEEGSCGLAALVSCARCAHLVPQQQQVEQEEEYICNKLIKRYAASQAASAEGKTVIC